MMSAAQQAQQNNRHTDGRYAEGILTDPGTDILGCCHDEPELDEFDWERIDSMIGQQMRLDPERTVNPPKISPDDNVAQATRKLMLYVKKTQDLDNVTDAEIAEMVGLQPTDQEMPDRLRSAFDLTPSMRVVVGLDDKGRPVYLSIDNTLKRTGSFRGGFSAANISQRLVAHQFAEQFAAQNPDIDQADIDRLFRRLEDKSITGKGYAYIWDEARFSPEVRDGLIAAGGPDIVNRIDTMTAEEAQQLLDTLPRKEGLMVRGHGIEKPMCYSVPYLDPAGRPIPGHTRMVYPDTAAAELAGTTDRAKRAQLNRTYRSFLEEQMQVEQDYQMQRSYIRKGQAEHSATVFEQKKNIPQTHLDAAEQSFFRSSGDFGHVEVDERTGLDELHHVEKEWGQLRKMLPRTGRTPDLRFRLTGRHKATGVYHPHVDNIAVDPRHPDSFLHEFVHHVDHTAAGGRNVSSGDDFRPLLRQVQRAVATIEDPQVRSKLTYYQTPTEVLSRTAEVYYAWTRPGTSLNGTAERYADSPAYKVMEPMRDQIIAFWDAKLAELGVDMPA